MQNFARGVACPADAAKKAAASRSFFALFRDVQPSPHCADRRACMMDDICWGRLFYGSDANLIGYSTEASQASDNPFPICCLPCICTKFYHCRFSAMRMLKSMKSWL
jgi:hypothetical protein